MDPSEIEVLECFEAVRRRPAMYCGGGNAAQQQVSVVKQLVEAAIHPLSANRASRLTLTHFAAQNAVGLADDGVGLPVDPWKHDRPFQHSRLEIGLLTLGCGGPFGPTDAQIEQMNATHGFIVGIGTVASALGERLRLWTVRDGIGYNIGLSRGGIVELLHAAKGPFEKGTAIYWQPDSLIFGDARFNPETLRQVCNSLAPQNPSVALEFASEPKCRWY